MSKVDFKPKRTKLDDLMLKAESSIKEGRADVTITSKGKDYNIRIDYMYTPSLGWFLMFVGLPTRWRNPMRKDSSPFPNITEFP